MKRIFYILVMTFCFNGFAYSLNNDIRSEFEKRFEEFSKRIKTIKAEFTQEKEMAVLENKVSMNGVFFYDSKGDISLDYSNPKGNKILFSGDKFMIVNSGKKTIANIKANPMLRQLSEMLIACMTGDVTKFKNGWNITYSQNEKEYILTLTPINKRVSKMINIIILNFIKEDMSLSKMKMIEKGDNISTYSFFNKQFNKELESGVFDLK